MHSAEADVQDSVVSMRLTPSALSLRTLTLEAYAFEFETSDFVREKTDQDS